MATLAPLNAGGRNSAGPRRGRRSGARSRRRSSARRRRRQTARGWSASRRPDREGQRRHAPPDRDRGPRSSSFWIAAARHVDDRVSSAVTNTPSATAATAGQRERVVGADEGCDSGTFPLTIEDCEPVVPSSPKSLRVSSWENCSDCKKARTRRHIADTAVGLSASRRSRVESLQPLGKRPAKAAAFGLPQGLRTGSASPETVSERQRSLNGSIDAAADEKVAPGLGRPTTRQRLSRVAPT